MIYLNNFRFLFFFNFLGFPGEKGAKGDAGRVGLAGAQVCIIQSLNPCFQ